MDLNLKTAFIIACAALICAPCAVRALGAAPAPTASNTISAIMHGMAKSAAGQKFRQALNFEHGAGGQPRDTAKALMLLEDSARDGYAPAQVLLAEIYMTPHNGFAVKTDDAKAAALLQGVIAQHPDNAPALYYLGVLYGDGRGGLPEDLKKQFDYYTQAATAGFAPAEHGLGVLYTDGGGVVSQDDAKAVHWTTLAAQQGLPESQYNLGYMYVTGSGVEKSVPTALAWFEKAAASGFPPALLTLGNLYRTGRYGVQEDAAKALIWMQKAAKTGNGTAQMLLGAMYGEGEGTPKSEIKSYFWYSLATASGESGLILTVEIFLLRHSLPADDVKAADAAVAAWKTSGVIPSGMF